MPAKPPVFTPLNKPAAKAETLRKRDYDKTRENSSARGYGYKWQKERKRFLHANPLCVVCAEKKNVRAASVIDHVIPHKGDASLFWDRKNWQALCAQCHNRKTATIDSAFAAGGRGAKSLPPPPPETA